MSVPLKGMTCDSSETSSCLLVIVDIDVCLLPLASWNLALEHDVDLTVRSALHLRQLEVCNNQAEQASATPDITALASNCRMLATAGKVYREKELTIAASGVEHV